MWDGSGIFIFIRLQSLKEKNKEAQRRVCWSVTELWSWRPWVDSYIVFHNQTLKT